MRSSGPRADRTESRAACKANLSRTRQALDAGLRSATRRAVGTVLREAGITTVLVTHDQAEALSFADQVAVMRDGVLAQVGSPLTVYSAPADRATAEFLGDAVLLDGWVQGQTATCALGRLPVGQTTADGPAQLMLRPEQIRVDDDGPIGGIVVDTDYFGSESTVRVLLTGPGELPDPPQAGVISIRHSNASIAPAGTPLRLRVEGSAIAFPR